MDAPQARQEARAASGGSAMVAAMSEPASMEEYTRLYHERVRMEGFGFEVKTVLPCPFCAAPDFMEMKPAELAMTDDGTWHHTCDECGRTLRLVFVRDEHGSRMEFAQTGGADPPEWLKPAPPDARE